MKKTHNLYLIALFILLLNGCSSSQKSTNKNVAGIYMPGLNLIDPEIIVFHKNDTLSELHFRINSADVLYTKRREDSTFSANILIQYELTDEQLKAVVDTASISFRDFGDNKQKKFLDGVISLNTQSKKSYLLKITFNDVNRDQYIKKTVVINKLDLSNIQNYLVMDTNRNVIFKNYFNTNEYFLVEKNAAIADSIITLSFYKSDFPIAKPPFSEDNEPQQQLTFEPEFKEPLIFDSLNTIRYQIKEKGLYALKINNATSGPIIFNFQENFPEIKSVENMVSPMRYISTKNEYESLLSSNNQKSEMDKFWKEVAGSNDRARTLIREYFKRVESSNNFFTSYKEGWKTDRGIIYIIYGIPNIVYKHQDYENWIYGEENNMMSMSFVFRKVNNSISGNDYVLSRSPVFKSSWYRAVDSWRSGRVY